MTDRGRGRKTRSIERSITIEASREAVWNALTDAEELTRWFPLKARVEPGEGGSVWMSWEKGEFESETPITAWKENELLSVAYERPDPATGDPLRVTQEYRLEGRGGTTTLRLVHSGFSTDSSWDELYDGTVRGWDFELRGLKLYLERHLGNPRRIVHANRVFDAPVRQAWDLLTGPRGLVAEGSLAGAGEGDRLDVRTANGLRLTGTVWIHDPPLQLAAVVENLGAAYLRAKCENCWTQPGRNEANLWLSTYGLPPSDVAGLSRSLDELLGALFDRTD
ncbi:MAG: SRPBCC domain-containing protein [Acidobacteriota bacterium]|nr:SRPBCC domain-containing protein [Acidobacteriota bacterium]